MTTTMSRTLVICTSLLAILKGMADGRTTSLAPRAEPAPHLCRAHYYHGHGHWVGRFCDRGFVAPRGWFDLCWTFLLPTGQRSWVYVDEDAMSRAPTTLKALLNNGLGAAPKIDDELLEPGAINPARLPTLPGYTYRPSFCCPRGYVCYQHRDQLKDAHIYCIRDYDLHIISHPHAPDFLKFTGDINGVREGYAEFDLFTADLLQEQPADQGTSQSGSAPTSGGRQAKAVSLAKETVTAITNPFGSAESATSHIGTVPVSQRSVAAANKHIGAVLPGSS